MRGKCLHVTLTSIMELRQSLAAREEALRNRHMKTHERWSEHTKQLPPLRVGDFVRIQNQIGHHPKKWDKTGTVIEVRQFNQYVVRVDGSGRVTLRNRKFLHKYAPVVPRQPHHTINNDLNYMQRPTKSSHLPLALLMISPIRTPPI